MAELKSRWMVGFWRAALLVAMTASPNLVAESQAMMHGGHDRNGEDDHSAHYLMHLLKHAKEIGLTQEQIGKLKSMKLDFKRAEVRLEADTKVAKLELEALLEDEQADLNAIQAKVDQLKKAEGACLVAAIKSKRSAMAMLTPDQREKERLAHEQMKAGRQQGGGMGGMMGGMGGMMGSMGSSGQGQDRGDHGSVGSGGGQQHQH